MNVTTQYCIGPWSLYQGLIYANDHYALLIWHYAAFQKEKHWSNILPTYASLVIN